MHGRAQKSDADEREDGERAVVQYGARSRQGAGVDRCEQAWSSYCERDDAGATGRKLKLARGRRMLVHRVGATRGPRVLAHRAKVLVARRASAEMEARVGAGAQGASERECWC
jgi:hypothetical protein